MEFDHIGPSLYVDSRGRHFLEKEGSFTPLKTKETEAEDRYVKRHMDKKEDKQ